MNKFFISTANICGSKCGPSTSVTQRLREIKKEVFAALITKTPKEEAQALPSLFKKLESDIVRKRIMKKRSVATVAI